MLYIDSADRAELTPLLATQLFEGVTTNPLILHRAGLGASDLPDLARWLRDNECRRFFAQATGSTVDELRRSAAAITELEGEAVVKLVATSEGFAAARELADAGRKVLITAVYHPTQMLLAAAAGAHFIAPYVGRATESGRDGLALVRQMTQGPGDLPRVLAASLRSVDQLGDVVAAGAQDATLSAQIATALLGDELTLAATAEFETVAQNSVRAA